MRVPGKVEMSIFNENARLYWGKGYPAIPLVSGQKRPAIQGWQEMANRLPTEEEREIWLATFPNGNIGMPMGPASGLVAIDIDTDDPKVLEVIDGILPPSPWERVGKKGSVRIYRYSVEQTTRIKDANGSTLVEILSQGSQIVLPPSIHPDTQKPYTANCNLYELDPNTIPTLPPNFEKVLREAFKAAGIEVSSGAGHGGFTKVVPAGARDSKMVDGGALCSGRDARQPDVPRSRA